MASIPAISCKSQSIYSNKELENNSIWTSAKIKQVALYIFAALLVCFALVACFFLPPPYHFLPIGAAAPALGITHTATQIKDFEDPAKLNQYRAQAAKMSFQEIYHEFGLKVALDEDVISPEALNEKFNAQVANMDFSSVIKAFDLDELAAAEVGSPKYIQLLRKLKDAESRYRERYQAAKSLGINVPKARAYFHRQLDMLDAEYNHFMKSKR